MTEKELDKGVAAFFAAVETLDTKAIVATFAEDAIVNDNQREFRGTAAIQAWVEREIVGDKVTIDVREVVENYGNTVVRGAYDGEYDKTNLPPGDLILSHYFSVRDGRISSLIVLYNRPAVLK